MVPTRLVIQGIHFSPFFWLWKFCSRGHCVLFQSHMWISNMFLIGNGPHSLLCSGLRALRGENDCANYCENFILYKQFNPLKPTGYVMHHQFNIQQLYALPTLYLCFIFIWEQTGTCATYSINWLGFITEMKSVYSAVRTGSLNKAVCASSVKG